MNRPSYLRRGEGIFKYPRRPKGCTVHLVFLMSFRSYRVYWMFTLSCLLYFSVGVREKSFGGWNSQPAAEFHKMEDENDGGAAPPAAMQ